MLQDWLTLTSVAVVRKTLTTDSYGESSAVSTTTTLPRAAIWSPGQSAPYVSDKIARQSSHVLVTVPGDYTFTDQDAEVTYGGKTYKIAGPTDNVLFLNEIAVTPLERIS